MAIKTTLMDVAKACDVSIATVSRVLNMPETVKEETRLKIQRAMDEMGYVAEKTPEPKKERESAEIENGNSSVILTILPEMINPFYGDVVGGIISTADYHGYECIQYCTRRPSYSFDQLKELVDRLHVEGVILLGKVTNTRDLERLDACVPVIQCAEYDAQSKVPYVSIDDYAAAKTAVRLLLQGGHQRIAFANGPLSYKYAVERERGYRDALKEAGLEVDEHLITHQATSELEIALSGMQRIITKDDHPDAVFAASDILAVAAVKAAIRIGLEIPRDIAVLGFDGTYISNLVMPSLSTVSQRGNQMGVYACDMLLDRIEGRKLSNAQLIMDVHILVREST